jgi:hypothetical protein
VGKVALAVQDLLNRRPLRKTPRQTDATTEASSPVTLPLADISWPEARSQSAATLANATHADESQIRSSGREDGAVARSVVLHTAVEREEHAANVLRLRKAVLIGCVLWPLYFLMDYLMSAYVDDVPFASYFWLRGAGWLLILAAALILTYARNLSRRTLLIVDTVAYGGASMAVALMCVLQGGISPYAAGIPIISTTRAAFASQWRLGLWPLGVRGAQRRALSLAAATRPRGHG